MSTRLMPPCPRRMVISFCLLGACLAGAGSEPGAVVAWGWNGWANSGQANTPPGLSNVVAIAAGSSHSLALKSDGKVVAWGDNTYGQTKDPQGMRNEVAIAGGYGHSLALLSNGTVVGWGWNAYGQTNSLTALSNAVAIAAGLYHNLALRNDRTVVAWGWNNNSQTNVPLGLTNVVAIAAGGQTSLALRSDGTVVVWGYNIYGQTDAPQGLSNVVAIAEGDAHSLALQSDGTVTAWGGNNYGQTNVPAGLNDVVAVAAGGDQSLALNSDGTAVAWGYSYDQTGVPPGLGNVISLALGAGTNLSAAVASAGPFVCQWSLDGLPIPGATGSSLVISNFALTKAGTYSVAVTSQYGYATAVSVLRLPNSPVILVDGIDVGGGSVSRTNRSQITMSSTFGSGANIYYTVDGSPPSYLSIPYQGSFQIGRTATIRALAYDPVYLSWAEAAPITVQIWPIYPLTTTTPGGGALRSSPPPYSGANFFVSNTIVAVAATPSAGWSFLGWLGDASGPSSVASLLMNRDMAVEALFGTAVGSNVLGAGQILLDPQVPLYPFGTVIRATAMPQTGYYLVSWAGALSGSNNPSLLLATNASPVVTALFGPLTGSQYTLTVVPQGPGSVSMSPYSNRYSSGTVVTLTAVASPGESFVGWSGDASGSQNPLSVTMNQSRTIAASFTQHPLLSTAPPLNGMAELGFRFSLIGQCGASLRIDGSPDLRNWIPLGWITNSFGVSQFLDIAAPTNPSRFYRAFEQ